MQALMLSIPIGFLGFVWIVDYEGKEHYKECKAAESREEALPKLDF